MIYELTFTFTISITGSVVALKGQMECNVRKSIKHIKKRNLKLNKDVANAKTHKQTNK